ncbi:TIGR02996 domain-containing protein [Fimbriiglobus ruber]|uniref:TIGR02996 domain-containing protein n=1 Tax=Fimbriiglobus ruber TaxID=1908690 RepID=A0A225DWM9_9BACT|nr:TIGR02996 domain-containing protein [Fimbriiglobus ruber]OWK40567.1 hypothetical protein FRUB_05486 [Fimbriiglobus ruber]
MTVAPAERAFLAAIAANRADDLPRLVYADWLEEQGRAARARFIRLQIEYAHLLGHTDRTHPSWRGVGAGETHPFAAEAGALLAGCRTELGGAIDGEPVSATLSWTEFMSAGDGPTAYFDRGFVRRLTGVSVSRLLPQFGAFLTDNPGLERVRFAWEDLYLLLHLGSTVEINVAGERTVFTGGERIHTALDRAQSLDPMAGLTAEFPGVQFEMGPRPDAPYRPHRPPTVAVGPTPPQVARARHRAAFLRTAVFPAEDADLTFLRCATCRRVELCVLLPRLEMAYRTRNFYSETICRDCLLLAREEAQRLAGENVFTSPG